MLHDDLLDCQDGRNSAGPHSLGNIAPHIQHIDAILKVSLLALRNLQQVQLSPVLAHMLSCTTLPAVQTVEAAVYYHMLLHSQMLCNQVVFHLQRKLSAGCL